MSSKEHRKLNKIAAKYCAEYYVKCQKCRNEACHSNNKQIERIKNWLKKEREEALNSKMQQVKERARKFATDEEQSEVNKMKKWIMNLKKIKTKVEKTPKEDICRCMNI